MSADTAQHPTAEGLAPVTEGLAPVTEGLAPVAEGLAEVRRAVEQACVAAGRRADAVTLVAVSKTQEPDAIAQALASGQRVFGENRVQEAKAKWPELKARFQGVELHLIGPLQTNKVRDALKIFDVIETLDRPRLAQALAEEMAASGRRPRCLIEVNTGEEPQKAGIAPAEVDAFVTMCRETYGLAPAGVMCIPPADEEPALHFALLTEIARRNGLTEISMGMSADFVTAIRFGATHVRVGTAIFGHRPPPPPTPDAP